MANHIKKAQQLKAAYQQIVKTKTAELDTIDDQLMALDSTLPAGTTNDKFDLLAEKREQLEDEIKKAQERILLISEWEKLKNGDWSEEIKSELKNLDQNFASIADGASTSDPMMGSDPMMSTPPPDFSAAPATDVPPAPADPAALDAPAPEAAPAAPEMNDATSESAALPPPMASTNAKKNNYQNTNKKGSTPSTQKGDNHMATQSSKPSLKEKLAEAKKNREAISKEAKTRVASAWTIAKTMLPTAPSDVQKAFAANLLTNSTKVLTAALRQTAVNAHYTKVAETFKQVHKVELNDLLEDPSVLTQEKKAVESELKGEAKSAAKVADDHKDAGPQPKTYDDGLEGFGKEFDASKAGERPDAGEKPGQTINLSDGKSASKKKACSGSECKGCEGCKKTAAPEDEAPVAPEAPVDAPAGAPADAPVDAPSDMPSDIPAEAPAAAPEDAAAEIITDEKKMVIEEKIEEAQEAIKALESEILEESDDELDASALVGEKEGEEEGLAEGEAEGEEEELDLSKVFNNDEMEDKVSSLANEDEHTAGEEGEDDFFAPSASRDLEASLDDDGTRGLHDMFSMAGADGDPLASLMGSMKSAAEVAGINVIPSSTGEAADKFTSDVATSDDRDSESDHEGDLWAEAIELAKPEASGQKRVTQDSTNELEAPKKATLKRIKNIQASNESNFGESLLGNFFGDEA